MIEGGIEVEHLEFGIGRVISVFGEIATVKFFGEVFDVDIDELQPRANAKVAALRPQGAQPVTDLAFRKVFEAVNLGVVPGDPDQLVDLTIGGQEMANEMDTRKNLALSAVL